jgi:hypothetical protein
MVYDLLRSKVGHKNIDEHYEWEIKLQFYSGNIFAALSQWLLRDLLNGFVFLFVRNPYPRQSRSIVYIFAQNILHLYVAASVMRGINADEIFFNTFLGGSNSD